MAADESVEIDSGGDTRDSLPTPRHRGFTASARKAALRENVREILSNSTLTPFRWLRKCYRCFFCRDLFKTPKEWREHQGGHDTVSELAAALNLYWESTVYVDVSRISCNRCSEPVSDLSQLIDHLVSRHGVQVNRDTERALAPYKLDDEFVHCLLCEKRFRVFSHVLVHAHKEHKGGGEVLCEVCGQNYKSLSYLKNHIQSEHSGGVECPKCGLRLRYTELRSHMQREHGKSYKCTSCPQVFATQYKRARHSMLAHGDREAVSCHLCPRTFLFRSTMKRHLRQTHLRERDSECGVCGWRSFGGHALRKHMLKHSTARDVQCPECEKAFKSRKTMKQHCDNVHKGKPKTETDARLAEKRRKDELSKLLATIIEYTAIMPFKWYANKYMCFYCCCPFVDSASLKQHTRQEHRGSKPPSLLRAVVGHSRIKLDVSELKVCAKCPRAIGTLEEALQHIQSHGVSVDEHASRQLFAFKLSDEGMSCVECGQRFRFFGPLLAHSHRLHNKTAAYLCEICGQGFVAKANVDSHVRSVHAVRRARVHGDQLRCPKCPEVLGSRYLRKRHLALVHDVKSAQFACAQCPKVFTEMSTLVQHNARVHLRERAFACDVCGFRVFSGDLLRRHMVRHDDSRPHQCEFCKKCFQRKKTLDFHRRIHTNDRRYACKECGKAFVQVTSLKLHLRVHHGPSDAK